jgi:hypothetical protein
LKVTSRLFTVRRTLPFLAIVSRANLTGESTVGVNMPRSKTPPTSEPITVTVNGKDHTGSFYVERGMLTVRYALDQKEAQVGGMQPEPLARMIMREIIAKVPKD